MNILNTGAVAATYLFNKPNKSQTTQTQLTAAAASHTQVNYSASAKSAGSATTGTKTASTLYHAQSIAQQFMDLMQKSPEQLMRDEILRELGYSEEQLSSMDAKERAKIEEKIQAKIEEKIEQALFEKGLKIDL